jgi:hypothetical protein
VARFGGEREKQTTRSYPAASARLVRVEAPSAVVLGIEVHELPPEVAEATRESLLQKFGANQSYELNTNNLSDYAAVQHPDSWEWVDEFLTDEPVLLFYDSSDDRSVFRLNGRQVKSLLAECFMFVFYVANERHDYMIAQNDHDCILGCGTAKSWVQGLSPRHDAWAATLNNKSGNP